MKSTSFHSSNVTGNQMKQQTDSEAKSLSHASDNAVGPTPGPETLLARLEANARLIAAAPDLLAALKALADAERHRDDDDPILLEARAKARLAIVKAESQ